MANSESFIMEVIAQAEAQGVDATVSALASLQKQVDQLARHTGMAEKDLRKLSSALETVSGAGSQGIKKQLTQFQQYQAEIKKTTRALQDLAAEHVMAGGRTPLSTIAGSGVMSPGEARKVLAAQEAEGTTAQRVAKQVIDAEKQKQQAIAQTTKMRLEYEARQANLRGDAQSQGAAWRTENALADAESSRKKELRDLREAIIARSDAERTLNSALDRTAEAQDRASKSQAKATVENKKSEESIISLRYANYDLATTLLATSAAITGLGFATMSTFAEMESGFTKVERTTGLYGSALAPVTDQLLQLSRVLPVTTSEIQDLAARGAQMGIAADEVAGFAEVMAKFVATSPEVDVNSVAESFGRLANLTGSRDFEALASAIAQVGVNSAATDAQIIKTTQEMARATNATSLTADEVIGLAAAFASLGIAPEAARGIMNQFFTQLDKGVAGMNDSLAVAANIMGITQEQASQLFQTDAGTFFQQFVSGLSGVENITVALSEMGLSGQRLLPAFKALAQDTANNAAGQSVLANALRDANQGFVERTELERQYAPIADDLNSKMVLLGNAFRELAYTIGLELAPSLKFGIDAFTGIVNAISDFISTPVGETLTRTVTVIAGAIAVWAGLRGVIALATASTYAFSFVVRGLGGAGIISSLGGLAKAFIGIGTAAGHGATGVLALRGALLALGRAVVIGAVFSYIAEWIFNTGEAAVNAGNVIGEFANFLLDTGQAINDFFGWGDAAADPTYKAIRSWSDGLKTWGESLIRQKNASDLALNGVNDLMDGVYDLADAFDGGGSGVDNFGEGLGDLGGSATDAAREVRTLVDYANDLRAVWDRAFEIRFSGSQTADAITSTFLSLRDASEAAAKKIRDLNNDIRGLSSDIDIQEYFLSIAVEYGDTQRAEAIEADLAKMRAELADKTAELKKEQDASSKSLVGNTQGAIENRKQITSLVQQYQAHIEALAASGMSQDDLARATQRLKDDFISQATQLGYNRRELEVYARAFDDVAYAIRNVPRNITVRADTDPAKQAFNEMKASADKANTSVNNLRNNLGRGFSIPAANTGPLVDAGLKAEAAALRKDLANRVYSIPLGGLYQAVTNMKSDRLKQLESWGYASGGYTGSGGKYEPAGIVHKGEYVIPKHMVNQTTGLPYADALGRLMGGIRGYASGGATAGSGAVGTQQVALTAGTIQAIAHAVKPILMVDGQQLGEVTSRAYSHENTVGAY